MNILRSRQPKQVQQIGIKFVEPNNKNNTSKSQKSKSTRRTKKKSGHNKENGTTAPPTPLAKGRSDIYTKLRKQIELLETDTQEAQRKIEELEQEEEKLLLGSHAKLIEMDHKFATVEEGLKDQIVRLQADFHMQQLVIDEKNAELAAKNDVIMRMDGEIEELKEKVKRVNDKLEAAARSLAW